MQEFINIFQNHRGHIADELLAKIRRHRIAEMGNERLDEAFAHFDALETIYAVDENFSQLSPIFHRETENGANARRVKEQLKAHVEMDERGTFISAPYRSRKNGRYLITLVKRIGDRLVAFDFDLYRLLREHRHTDTASGYFVNGVKLIYGLIGICLSAFALILVVYAMVDFARSFAAGGEDIFHAIFKSTIALTLGLAIFDLAKNLLEHEVVFKSHINEAHGGNRLLVKFMVSIIIALAIEALMTVFKIAIYDYREILYAVYLLGGIGFLLIAMSQFNKHLPPKTER